MKRIVTVLFTLGLACGAYAQGNSGNHVSNNWGQNGNGNAYGQGNGNGNGNGNNGNGNGNGNSSPAPSETSESAGASQATHVALSNAIEITFTANDNVTGGEVSLAFNNVNDYANGIESDEQELKVRSNKKFTVGIKTNNTHFTYSGNTTPAPTMPVSGVLAVKVTDNNTGGAISSPFSASAYSTLNNSSRAVLSGCNRGGAQAFSVQYKATPGFAYPAGSYSVDVVYTATQE